MNGWNLLQVIYHLSSHKNMQKTNIPFNIKEKSNFLCILKMVVTYKYTKDEICFKEF